MTIVVPIVAAVVLLLGLSAQWSLGKPDTTPVDLAATIPSELVGWQCVDLPVADSPEMKKKVAALLNYDGVVFREYRQGSRAFLVYVSYWKPGRISPVQIAVHTPDNCWVANGMVRRDESSARLDKLGVERVLPGEFRVFLAAGKEVQVVYWLAADHQTYGGGPDDRGHLIAALAQRLRLSWAAIKLQLKRSNQSARIYYVRISTEGNLQELFHMKSLDKLWTGVSSLGLRSK